jgi:AbrB family looped-hinge helix DNA binding protein
MILSRISPKGQITLPRKVRQALDVKAGDRVLFLVEDKTVRLQPVATNSARSLAGSLRGYAKALPSGPTRSAVKKEVARAAAQEE